MGRKRFVVFTGSWTESAGTEALPHIGSEDFIVCADGGYENCRAAGIRPKAVIGDFDSLPEERICEIESLGIERVVHPCEKDDTDTMLCLRYGAARGYEEFLIIGGIGGDTGHTMANIQALSFLADMDRTAEIVTEIERIFMADGMAASDSRKAKPAAPVTFSGRPGTCFSVLSYAERSSGVFVKNAKYELADAVLTHSCPVGVKNEFINKEPVTVSVRCGRLLIISGR